MSSQSHPTPSSSSSRSANPLHAQQQAPPETDIAGHNAATYRGGLQGAALGALLAGSIHLLLRKKPTYANFGPGPKAFGYVCVVVPCISISAEKAGEAFERSRWYGLGKNQMDRQAAKREARWEAMTSYERLADWSKANKWSLISGAWVGSLGIAFALVARTPQTFSQKLVQARMWAQGLTVGTLLGSALLAGATSTGNKVVQGRTDHSWADLLATVEDASAFLRSLLSVYLVREQEGELKEEDLKRIRAETVKPTQ